MSFNPGRGGRHWYFATKLLNDPGWDDVKPYLHWIILAAVVGVTGALLWIYCASIYRFILLDCVVTGRCELKDGWRRWKSCGAEYFVWVLGFGICSTLGLGLLVGVPVWAAYKAGWFDTSEQHMAGLIAGGVLLALLFLILVIVLAMVDLLARDFLIPVMAFENVGAMDGWRRLLSLMSGEKSAYVVYILMKIVLAVGSAIFFAIVDLIVILILAVPLVILMLFAVALGKLGGWSPAVVMLLAGFALLALVAVLFMLGLVYSPGLVFFESYALEFFGARYEPLSKALRGGPGSGNAPPESQPPFRPPRMPVPPWPSEPFPT